MFSSCIIMKYSTPNFNIICEKFLKYIWKSSFTTLHKTDFIVDEYNQK
jgi:hypothetical protein